MPNFAVMDTAKFKKAIESLPDDPTQSVEFSAFQATRKGNNVDVFFGFYVDTAMQPHFKKDKDKGYQSPDIFQGRISRRAKHPTKRLVVGLTKPATLTPAAARELRQLAKPVLKECSLKYVFTFLQAGIPEPDLTAEELADLHAVDPLRPNAVLPTAAAPFVPAKPAKASPTHALDAAEYDRFVKRLSHMATEFRVAPQFVEKAREASQYAKANPKRAHAALDALAKEMEAAWTDSPELKLAGILRGNWETIVAERWETNPDLVRQHAIVQDLIAKKDVKNAAAALQSVHRQVAAAKAPRDRALRNWLYRRADFTADFDFYDLADEVAPKLNLPKDVVHDVLATKVKELKDEAAALRPQGFKPDKSKWRPEHAMINPLLPQESRPRFDLDEAVALNIYSDANYKAINTFIRDGKPPLVPPNDKAYADLKRAFAKAKPFAEPVEVGRGMNFDTEAGLKAFLDKCYRSMATGEVFSLLNFVSTGSAGIPKAFDGNVLMTIIARHGIDLQPYTKTPKERELLLNENTMIYVHEVVKKGAVFHVRAEQVLPKSVR
ncbi:MAG: ADP-ribosyltransferase [Pirellulales bacterium]